MFNALKIVSQISETINRVLDENKKEHLHHLYNNGGLTIRAEIAGSEIFLLLRPLEASEPEPETSPELPEPADPEPEAEV